MQTITDSTPTQDIAMTRGVLPRITLDAGKVLAYVRESFLPDEVFPFRDLDLWARNNDYTRADPPTNARNAPAEMTNTPGSPRALLELVEKWLAEDTTYSVDAWLAIQRVIEDSRRS